MHEHDCGPVRVAAHPDRKADSVAGSHLLVRHLVMLDNLSTASAVVPRETSVSTVRRTAGFHCPDVPRAVRAGARWTA
ncbi:predicted protein [Streptomyces sp. AA4]|nr:predicted protein [Streptomyces sp. AA4]